MSIAEECFRRSLLRQLRRLAKDEDDKLDKLDPTIRYLQKMGPNHLNLILQQSDWLFKEDPKFALRVSAYAN